jgi:hypothetical protein
MQFMSPEQQARNVESWKALEADFELHPDSDYWIPWKALARRLIKESAGVGLHPYFRAGQGMQDVIFSTLDHRGLRHEPRVTVQIRGDTGSLRVAYSTFTLSISLKTPEMDYTLPFDEGFATLRRFLNQLWTATVPEPIPENLRSPLSSFSAPVLP